MHGWQDLPQREAESSRSYSAMHGWQDLPQREAVATRTGIKRQPHRGLKFCFYVKYSV